MAVTRADHARRKKPYTPRELPKRVQGIELCEPYGVTQICVTAGKFGWSGWLRTNDGKNLAPININRARSAADAMRVARTSANRIRARRPSPNRR